MATSTELPVKAARGWRGKPAGAPVPVPPADPVPAPPRARRRWGLLAAMAAVVCVGALGNVWLHAATSNAHQVVAARTMIERGTVISRDDLVTVQVGTDPALRPVPASQIDALVGQRAAVDVAAGSLLTAGSVTSVNVPAAGFSLVGVAAMLAMMPGSPLVAGDRVRVVATPGLQGEVSAGSSPVSVAAVVVSTRGGTDPTGAGAQTIITVQVRSGDAAQLAAMAATGRVAVVLDSRDR